MQYVTWHWLRKIKYVSAVASPIVSCDTESIFTSLFPRPSKEKKRLLIFQDKRKFLFFFAFSWWLKTTKDHFIFSSSVLVRNWSEKHMTSGDKNWSHLSFSFSSKSPKGIKFSFWDNSRVTIPHWDHLLTLIYRLNFHFSIPFFSRARRKKFREKPQ